MKSNAKIRIKPSHRGRLTELKKRTGKTEAELYKTGSPATRKMITFARSARKWHHADGGNLFAYGDPPTSLMMMNDPMYYGNTMYPEYVELVSKGKTKEATKSSKERDKKALKTMAKAGIGLYMGSADPFASAMYGGGAQAYDYIFSKPQSQKALGDIWDVVTGKHRKKKENKKASGGNLFAYGNNYGTGLRSHMDYGMEWNNKIDRALGIFGEKGVFSKAGQQVGKYIDVSNGDLDEEALKTNSTTPTGTTMACGGNLHKCGGNLFDYGGDFSNGLTMYNTGGTHEENPYEGVQVGTDNEGTPNLVEEGEVRYQDYIFSNRLSLNEELAEKYNIPKKYADATFAYIAEKMGNYSKEREYDPIAQRGLRADMERLKEAQEEAKIIKEQEEMMQQVQQIADELGVSPEDVIAGMQMQQEEAAQQEAIAQQQAMQQPTEEEMAMQQQEVPQQMMAELPYALGGTLLDYEDMDLSAPQKTKRTNSSYPNVMAVLVDSNKHAFGTNDLFSPDHVPLINIQSKYDRAKYTPEQIEKFKQLYESGQIKELSKEQLEALFQAYPELQQEAQQAAEVAGENWYEELMNSPEYDYRKDLNGWRYGEKDNWYNPFGETAYGTTSATPGSDLLYRPIYSEMKRMPEAEKQARYLEMREAMLGDLSRYKKGMKNNPEADMKPDEMTEAYMRRYDANLPKDSTAARFYNEKGELRKDWAARLYNKSFDQLPGIGHNIFGKEGSRYYFIDPKTNKPRYVSPEIAKQYSMVNTGDTPEGMDLWHNYQLTGKLLSDSQSPVLNPSVPAEDIDSIQQQMYEANIGAGEPTDYTMENQQEKLDEFFKNEGLPKNQPKKKFNWAKLAGSIGEWANDFIPLLINKTPDYSQADALVDYTNSMPKPTYKPIGDFVQYHPFDRQYAANQLRAQSAATRRNNINIAAGNRGYANAANLAANYQAQLADANMQRQADEANLAQQLQVAQFNRGTNQFNAEAFNRLQLQKPYEYQLGLQARMARANMHNALDTAYSNALSQNYNNARQRRYDKEREAKDRKLLWWYMNKTTPGAKDYPAFLDDYDVPWYNV